MGRRFPTDVLAALKHSKILRIRAGRGDHRFIGIWVVVVAGRVFVRSWSVEPDGWYRTFLNDSVGTIQMNGREVPVEPKGVAGATTTELAPFVAGR